MHSRKGSLQKGLHHEQEDVPQAVHAILGGSPVARLFGQAPGRPPSGRQAHQLGRQLHVQHRRTCIGSRRSNRSGRSSRSTTRSRCSARAIASTASPTVPTPSFRSKPMDRVVALDAEGAHGDRRGGDELRPIVPLPPSRGASRCTTSPRCRTSPSPAPSPPRRMARASRTATWRRRSRPWSSSRPMATS